MCLQSIESTLRGIRLLVRTSGKTWYDLLLRPRQKYAFCGSSRDEDASTEPMTQTQSGVNRKANGIDE